ASRRRHTRSKRDWSSDVCSSDLGAPVAMPWADRAPAVLQSWLGGQEMANAIADVVFGDAEPGGRLPTTLPLRLEHNPSFGNFPRSEERRVGKEWRCRGWRRTCRQ